MKGWSSEALHAAGEMITHYGFAAVTVNEHGIILLSIPEAIALAEEARANLARRKIEHRRARKRANYAKARR